MTNLISEIKENNQDFEFYPTTNEIIQKLLNDLEEEFKEHGWNRNDLNSFLDIGAGNGKVLNSIKEKFQTTNFYAIEKSQILISQMSKDVFIIGTEFYEQNLIDKNMDVVYCNPPYSDYEIWSEKIIKEASAQIIYLTIPDRFINSKLIENALEYRNVNYEIIGSFDFLNAEDRKARAKVNLIKIKFSKEKQNAFDCLFNEQFKDIVNDFEHIKEEPKEEEKFTKLVTGQNYVKSLVAMYQADLLKIQNNYNAVSKLDFSLLKEFGVNVDQLKHLLKEKLTGLKNIYWKELLSRTKEITDRLTTKNSRILFEKLQQNGSVDFTESNIYTTILWLIRHANDFIENQLLETYESFIEKANVKNYKSNKKVYEEDRWRYRQEVKTHIYLDYRLILEYWGKISKESYSNTYYRLDYYACDKIQDLLTVANNLGFSCITNDDRLSHYNSDIWFPGKFQEFFCHYKGNKEVLFEIKAHLNGNIHIRLNQKFAMALNVEYGRLKGWLHSKESASSEIQDSEAEKYFESNFNWIKNNVPLLANCA